MSAVDSGWSWVVLLASFYFHLGVGGAVYSLSVYYTSWVDDFHTGRGVASWVITLTMAFSMGSGPIAANLVARFGHRPVVIFGSLLNTIGLFASSFATNIYTLAALIGPVAGFGQGLQYLPSVAIIPLYFKRKRSLATGIAVSGVGVGAFLYPPLLTWLEECYTWRGAMFILSGFALNMVAGGALMRPVDAVEDGEEDGEVEGMKRDEEDVATSRNLEPLKNYHSDLTMNQRTAHQKSHSDLIIDQRSEKETCSNGVNHLLYKIEAGYGGILNTKSEEAALSQTDKESELTQQLLKPVTNAEESVSMKVENSNTTINGHTPNGLGSHTTTHTGSHNGLPSTPLIKPGLSSYRVNPNRHQVIHQANHACLALGGSVQHLRSPNVSQTQTFSSVRELRLRPFVGGSHAYLSAHRDPFTKEFSGSVSDRTVGLSHGDLLLSSSIFDLRKAEKKRHWSTHHLHTPDTDKPAGNSPQTPLVLPSPPSHNNDQTSPSFVLKEQHVHHSEKSVNGSVSPVSPPPTQQSRHALFSQIAPYLNLLKDPYFAVFTLTNFLACFTYLMPNVYMVDRAIELGVDKAQAALAISMYGAGNLFGRLALGWIADSFLDSLSLSAICLMGSGVATSLSPLCGASAVLHCLYGLVYGTFIGGFVTLTPLTLVELLGLAMVGRSYGLILFFQAVGFIAGTPLAGWVFDASGSYTVPFILHGFVIGISGLILIPLKVAIVRHRRQKDKDAAEDDDDYDDAGVKDFDDKIRDNSVVYSSGCFMDKAGSGVDVYDVEGGVVGNGKAGETNEVI